jgi:hypothetical protein
VRLDHRHERATERDRLPSGVATTEVLLRHVRDATEAPNAPGVVPVSGSQVGCVRADERAARFLAPSPHGGPRRRRSAG